MWEKQMKTLILWKLWQNSIRKDEKLRNEITKQCKNVKRVYRPLEKIRKKDFHKTGRTQVQIHSLESTIRKIEDKEGEWQHNTHKLMKTIWEKMIQKTKKENWTCM